MDKFKPGEYVVCIDISQKPFQGRERRDVITITKFKRYEVIENPNAYSDSITVINDTGLRKTYATRRFVSINEFRGPKIKKLMKRIKDD